MVLYDTNDTNGTCLERNRRIKFTTEEMNRVPALDNRKRTVSPENSNIHYTRRIHGWVDIGRPLVQQYANDGLVDCCVVMGK